MGRLRLPLFYGVYMYKVNVIRKFKDEAETLYLEGVQEMSNKAAELGEALGVINVIEKPKKKAKDNGKTS